MSRTETLDATFADLTVGQQCTARNYGDGVRCTRLAVVIGIKGCVHEHVRPVAHCALDRRMVEIVEMRCTECRNAGHECLIRVVYR